MSARVRKIVGGSIVVTLIGQFQIMQSEIFSSQAIRISWGHRRVACDVPCFWPYWRSSSVVQRVHVHPLGVSMTLSMEGEAYYPELELAHRTSKHAIASTRFNSDVPMPYFSWAEYNIQAPKVAFEKVKATGTSFIASNCHSLSHREPLVGELMGNMSVHSYGRCLNNMPSTTFDKVVLMRKHATHLAFENQCVDDYVTEKMWQTLGAGVIPVYYGAPNIASHAPNGSFIDARGFPDARSLAAHLNNVSSTQSLYDSYHAWRVRPLPRWFVNKYNFTSIHHECRVCLWANQARASWTARHSPV